MRIQTAEFAAAAVRSEQYPRDRRPEVAFAGRSNAGKSTLLNVLLNRRGLAHTSKTPGKTQTINFYDINRRYYFVDLPGYGFARVPAALRDLWGRAVTGYLLEREQLRLVAHLVDGRHAPTRNDQELLELLGEAGVPALIVATKMDKVRAADRDGSLAALRKSLRLPEDALVVPFSAITKEGLRELWRAIDAHLGN